MSIETFGPSDADINSFTYCRHIEGNRAVAALNEFCSVRQYRLGFTDQFWLPRFVALMHEKQGVCGTPRILGLNVPGPGGPIRTITQREWNALGGKLIGSKALAALRYGTKTREHQWGWSPIFVAFYDEYFRSGAVRDGQVIAA